MNIEVIDLFCGVGGLSAGFRNEGFKVVAGVDIDSTCKYAYETNIGAKFISKSVADIHSDELKSLYSKGVRRILIGCAPCQPFSAYTGRYRRNETNEDTDNRWILLRTFSDLIKETKPEIVSMENVPRLTQHPEFKEFVKTLEKNNYNVTWYKVNAEEYGVPQKRNRLVLFASRYGIVKLIQPTHKSKPMTVRDAIGSLPAIEAGKTHSKDVLHTSRGLSERNLRRLKATREGGSWKDWEEELQLDCHKKESGKSFGAVYGRMSWDQPSPVITTQCLGLGNGRFGHPQQDRAISIREAAILQSFPSNFQFVRSGEKVSGARLSRQIGNAVPPRLGEVVARSIKNHLEQYINPAA